MLAAVASKPDAALRAPYDISVIGSIANVGGQGAPSAPTMRQATVLVLDVVAHKCRFTWIPIGRFWDAMDTVESAAGETRGYLIVRSARGAASAIGK